MLRAATIAAVLSLVGPAAAFAQDSSEAREDLDLTIRLLPEGAEDGSEISRTITLPDSVPERVPRTVPGGNAELGDGASMPEGVDAPGLDIADDARSGELDGRELGQEMRERARENREDAGRGGDGPPGPPDEVPVPDDVPRPGPGDASRPDDVPAGGAGDLPDAVGKGPP